MWIEEQKNGKVKYCDRVKDISGKLRKITVTMDKKSKKNEDIAREILRTKAQDLRYVVDNNITFFEGLDIVFEKHYKNARTNTRHNNKSIINLIKKKGYDIKLNLINARYLKDLIEKLEKLVAALKANLNQEEDYTSDNSKLLAEIINTSLDFTIASDNYYELSDILSEMKVDRQK